MIRPSGLKAGLSAASASSVVSGRMPSSRTYVSPLTANGTISGSNLPSSVARWASCCERRPKASSSAREISHRSAIISAERPWGTRSYWASSSGGNGVPDSSGWATLAPMGRWPMCSTPAPMATSAEPEAMREAARSTADWADPHWRSTVIAGTVSGRPAWSHALRATLLDCSPTWETAPEMTSPTSVGSIPARSTSSV